MEGGFRFLLAGIVLIALAFSLMSVWPALTETKPRQAPGQMLQPAPTPQTPMAVIPPGQSSQQAPPFKPKRPQSQSGQTPANPMGLVANAKPQSIEVGAVYDWVFTKKLVVLLKEPGGEPHRASSINHAKLEILGGTRLRHVRSEDGWLLVKSPSRLFGWLPETDVSTRPPVGTEAEWSLFPSN